MGSENRRREKIIMVRVTQSEHGRIQQIADAHDLSMPELLRQLGQGHQPKSTLDAQHILELAKINGDLGRLGGLLKLWLAIPEKKGFANHLNVPDTLDTIRELMKKLEQKVNEL